MNANYAERVFVNGTGKSCDWCNGVKTGFRKEKAKQFLFRYEGQEGLFCCKKCAKLHQEHHGRSAT